MKRLLILILAMFAVASPIPALATQSMCADTMQMITMQMAAPMNHGAKKGSCCDEKHKACLLACDAMCVATIVPPMQMPVAEPAIRSLPPVSTVAVFAVAKRSNGLDRPPRHTV